MMIDPWTTCIRSPITDFRQGVLLTVIYEFVIDLFMFISSELALSKSEEEMVMLYMSIY